MDRREFFLTSTVSIVTDFGLTRMLLDDAETWEILQNGFRIFPKTEEWPCMRYICGRIPLKDFDRLVQAFALCSTSAWETGLLTTFFGCVLKQALPEQATLRHPLAHDVVKNTFGLIIYLEQLETVLLRGGIIDVSSLPNTLRTMEKSEFVDGARRFSPVSDQDSVDLFFHLKKFGWAARSRRSTCIRRAFGAYRRAYELAHGGGFNWMTGLAGGLL